MRRGARSGVNLDERNLRSGALQFLEALNIGFELAG
jgi:hypothetical protein